MGSASPGAVDDRAAAPGGDAATRALRVGIADDNAGIRVLLRALLELEQGFVVVGEAENGAEALRLAQEGDVDLLVLDLSMPGLDGLEVLEQLGDASRVCVVVYTGHSASRVEARARSLGARDVIVKGAAPGEVVERLRLAAVACGA